MELAFTVLAVSAAVAVLGTLARDVLLRLAAQIDLSVKADQAHDGFTPSMARWGYVGEKRGAK